jgi:hypothetical protein
MRIIKALISGISIFYFTTVSTEAINSFAKLKHGLPNILKLTNVGVYSDNENHISPKKQ